MFDEQPELIVLILMIMYVRRDMKERLQRLQPRNIRRSQWYCTQPCAPAWNLCSACDLTGLGCCLVAGQGGELTVREEDEAVRRRRHATAQEGPPPVRQVAQARAHLAPAPHPQAAPQGAPATLPVHR